MFGKRKKIELQEEVAENLSEEWGSKKSLVKEWDPKTAKYHYVLYAVGPKYMGLYIGIVNISSEVASGNKAWAERTAKHYDLEITEEEK